MPPARTSRPTAIGSPFLVDVALHPDRIGAPDRHPFDVPAIARGLPLRLETPVTMLVGENGTGKSTLLEALAWALGFDARGGDVERAYAEDVDGHALGRALALSWRQRVSGGFFLRAETFHAWVDSMEARGASFMQYGGYSLNQRSHGEAFFALFEERIEDGVYLLDEPEAALSPDRQLAFLALLHRLERSRAAQFIIATHSPILLCYPSAVVYGFGTDGIRRVDPRQTEHVRLTRDFLNAPERYFRHLFADDDEEA